MLITTVRARLAPSFNDSISWSLTSNGVYTVSSAYKSIWAPIAMDQDRVVLFQKICHIQVHERIRCILWMGVKGKLLTNVERVCSKICLDATCSGYNVVNESLIHLFHDCPLAREVWHSFVSPTNVCDVDFYDSNPAMWLSRGIHGRFPLLNSVATNILFVVCPWWLWKWRNNHIFGETKACPDRVAFLLQQVVEFHTHV